MEYLIILLIVLLLAHYNERLTHRSRIISLIFVCGYIILLMGLRYRVGIDTMNYMSSYDYTPNFSNFFENDFTETRFEPGYLLLCALCRLVTKEFWLLQLVHALILNVCVFIFIYRKTRNPFTGIAIYFVLTWLYFNTEVMRESLAIAIFLLNYENLRKQRWIAYYLLTLVSISFHYSAVILWLFPLVRYMKLNFWYIAACISILFAMPLIEYYGERITIISVADRVMQNVNGAETLNLNWRLANTIQSLICPVLAMIIYRKCSVTTEVKSYILLHIWLGIGAFTVPIIFSRFTNYTQMFVVVYIANLLFHLKNNLFLKHSMVLILCMSQLLYYAEMYRRWYPYESIFTMRKVPERESLWFNFN